MGRVLLIDDDTELCELLNDYLGADGFEVHAVHDGAVGLTRALEAEHDLVILDVMLPGMSGFDVLRELRHRGARVPVLMLTARGDDLDRIVGLEMGADDYLAKPFNPRELVARMRAVQRRAQRAPSSSSPVLVAGDVRLDPGTREVHRGAELINLTSVEFTLLEVLLRAAGQAVDREVLTQEVLGRPYSPYDRAIDVHVSNLRRKLGGGGRIKTIRGVGYQFADR